MVGSADSFGKVVVPIIIILALVILPFICGPSWPVAFLILLSALAFVIKKISPKNSGGGSSDESPNGGSSGGVLRSSVDQACSSSARDKTTQPPENIGGDSSDLFPNEYPDEESLSIVALTRRHSAIDKIMTPDARALAGMEQEEPEHEDPAGLELKSRNKDESERYGQIFVSFKRSDTPREFTSRIYGGLESAGFSYYTPESVQDEILPIRLNGIKHSRVSIPILSRDYVYSVACLVELEKMLECRKINGHPVIPVFYNLNRSDVKDMGGDWGWNFRLSTEREHDQKTINKWREVLREIADLPRAHSANLYKGFEGQLIDEVVAHVTRILRDEDLVVTDKLVGIDRHVEEMMRKLGVAYSRGKATQVCGEDVRVVVIWGAPDVGKTTLAKVVYNQVRHLFYTWSFLPTITSRAIRLSQQILIADLQKLENEPSLQSLDKGIEELETKFREQKVLIVLDRVNDGDQIKALAGKLTWFGPGSRIIVTTNKKEVLNAFEGGAVIDHMVKPLDDDHAHQLFCEHAFQGAAAQENSIYTDLSKEIAKASKGLPADIVRHASSLRGEMDIDIWRRTLDRLRKPPRPFWQHPFEVSDAGESELYDSIEESQVAGRDQELIS